MNTKILIADDEADIVSMLRSFFGRLRHETRVRHGETRGRHGDVSLVFFDKFYYAKLIQFRLNK